MLHTCTCTCVLLHIHVYMYKYIEFMKRSEEPGGTHVRMCVSVEFYTPKSCEHHVTYPFPSSDGTMGILWLSLTCPHEVQRVRNRVPVIDEDRGRSRITRNREHQVTYLHQPCRRLCINVITTSIYHAILLIV